MNTQLEKGNKLLGFPFLECFVNSSVTNPNNTDIPVYQSVRKLDCFCRKNLNARNITYKNMYQLEVKYNLVKHLFLPSEGWKVIVDVDAMERAKGSKQKPDKKEKVSAAESALKELGVEIGTHKEYGRIDVFASHPEKGVYLIEVEGESSKQKEQAMYSAIGQAILMMSDPREHINYGVAVPDLPKWSNQIKKIPELVKEKLNLKCFLVSRDRVREV